MTLKSSFAHSDIIDEVLYGNIQGQDMYYHQDGLNSVKALTDISGNIIVNYDYDAWGNPVGTMPSIANPFTYTGREYDKETGMYYYRARYYDAKVGRFVSKDPIGLAGGINLYSYVGNNPVNWIDPLGLHWLPTQHPAGLIPHTHAGANGPVTVVNPRDPGAWPGDPQHIKPSNCEKGCGAEFALCIGRVYAQRRNEARACLTLCGIAAATKNPGSIVACGICIGGGTLYIWDCYQKSCN